MQKLGEEEVDADGHSRRNDGVAQVVTAAQYPRRAHYERDGREDEPSTEKSSTYRKVRAMRLRTRRHSRSPSSPAWLTPSTPAASVCSAVACSAVSATACRGGRIKRSRAERSIAAPRATGKSLGPTGIKVDGSGTWKAKKSTIRLRKAIISANHRSVVRRMDIGGLSVVSCRLSVISGQLSVESGLTMELR